MPIVSTAAGDYPDQYTAFLTTTIQAYRKTLIDNVSEATPLWWWLNQRNRKRTQTGGESILQPLMHALQDVQSFSGLDTLDTAPFEGIAPAVFEWKNYTVPIVIPKDQLRANMGEAAVLSLVQAKMQQAEISFITQLNRDSILNGSDGEDITPAPAVDPKGITGLADILQNATQARVYGGISGSTNAFWANQFGTYDFDAFATSGIEQMRGMFLDCSRGNDQPDLILTDQTAFEEYEGSLVDDKRFVNTNAGDAGFESLAYRGSTIMFDRDLDAREHYIYMLNSNYLQLIVDPGVEMTSTPFADAEMVPNGQWASFSRIFWRGNLTCSNRARQGFLRGDT